MRKLFQCSLLVAGALLLGGCYINKNGYICSLALPEAYCDKEAYEKLTNPGKSIDSWDLSGRPADVRLQDWVACGGTWDGGYGLIPLPNGERRTTEQIQTQSRAVFHSIQRCMLRKHYEYIGECFENEISRAHPACRARAGEQWE